MTNWEKYYGSPEKTAHMIMVLPENCCPMFFYEGRSCADCENEEDGCEKAILEWLQEEAS